MPAIPVHHTDTSDDPWDGNAAVTELDKSLGPKVIRWEYAWEDKGEVDPDADASDKEDFAFPHHFVRDGRPAAASTKACSSAIGVLNGGMGGSRIPDSDREGVYKHLIAHLRDSGVPENQLPELKSAEPQRARKPRARRELARQPEYRIMSRPGTLEIRDASASPSGLVEVFGKVIVYGVPYEVVDFWGSFTETIHYGAFTPLANRADLDVRFLFNHKDMPLARSGAEASLILTDTPEALCVTAYLDPRMSAANDLIVAMQRGTVTQMSVGMVVDPAGDVWTGEDELGLPNVRDIYMLADVFDVSAVTFPASPTTSIALAQRMWSSVPVASRERTRRLWSVARDRRAGRTLSQHEADMLMHAIERLYTADTDAGADGARRAAPTAQDAAVAEALAEAHAAISKALAAQAQDPDTNRDPADARVWEDLEGIQKAITQAMKDQAADGAPDADEEPETLSGDPGAYQADPDGTMSVGDGNAPGVGAEDGTGTRSASSEPASPALAHAVAVDMDLLRLRRRPATV